VNINWPIENISEDELITSEKDANWPTLKELSKTNLFENLK